MIKNLLRSTLIFFLMGCVRERSIFFSKDLPEPLRPHPGALTVPINESLRPPSQLDWRLPS